MIAPVLALLLIDLPSDRNLVARIIADGTLGLIAIVEDDGYGCLLDSRLTIFVDQLLKVIGAYM